MRWQKVEQTVTGLLKVCHDQIVVLPAALDVELLHGRQLCSGDVLRSFFKIVIILPPSAETDQLFYQAVMQPVRIVWMEHL